MSALFRWPWSISIHLSPRDFFTLPFSAGPGALLFICLPGDLFTSQTGYCYSRGSQCFLRVCALLRDSVSASLCLRSCLQSCWSLCPPCLPSVSLFSFLSPFVSLLVRHCLGLVSPALQSFICLPAVGCMSLAILYICPPCLPALDSCGRLCLAILCLPALDIASSSAECSDFEKHKLFGVYGGVIFLFKSFTVD